MLTADNENYTKNHDTNAIWFISGILCIIILEAHITTVSKFISLEFAVMKPILIYIMNQIGCSCVY